MAKTNLRRASDQDFSLLGKFIGAVIHEINSPLDGVIRYLNLALARTEDNRATREYLKEAKLGLTNITKIIRSYLEFFWDVSLRQNQIDVNQLIEEGLTMFEYYILSYNIELKRFLAPCLPRLPNFGLKLVFNNIIKNACESMKNGGTLSIYTTIDNGTLEIRFEDTGEGVSLDSREKIFEPFFTTKIKGEGSGLGLAISKEIIQSYKGIIFAESNNGKGATFIIRLPINNNTYYSRYRE